MDQNESKDLKVKMLQLLYRDSDGNLNYTADMLEIGAELKCDEEISKSLTMQLHSEGFIQMVDVWDFLANMTEEGLNHLESFFIGTSRSMKSFEPSNKGLKRLDKVPSDGHKRAIPGKVILVVDDDKAVLDGMKRALQTIGYVTDTASDGKDGLAKAAVLKPCVIFLDVNMPEMDGTGVYDRLRKEAGTAEIPVIFLTANNPEHINERITAGNDTYYLQKPVSVALIKETLKNIF